MKTIDELKAKLTAASPEGYDDGPGMMNAFLDDLGARLYGEDGDCLATIHAHPLWDAKALADLIAAALPALPALLAVAEAAGDLVSWNWLHLLDDSIPSHSADVRADVAKLSVALRALKESP